MHQALPKCFLNIASYSSHENLLSLTIPMRKMQLGEIQQTQQEEAWLKLGSLSPELTQEKVMDSFSVSPRHRAR
jgi:hypothetical protein